MKHNKPARVRVGRLAFTCMLLAALLCMMSMMLTRRPDGETANPVTAVRIYIDGAGGDRAAHEAGGWFLSQLQYGEGSGRRAGGDRIGAGRRGRSDCTEGGFGVPDRDGNGGRIARRGRRQSLELMI